MPVLTNVHALIIDMDGVLWEGNRPLPGLLNFFQCLRKQSLPFVLATNNASLTQEQYISKLHTMGVDVSHKEILTSSMATAHYLAEQLSQNAVPPSAYVIGEEGLRQPLTQQGFKLIESFDPLVPADFVICGLDRQLTWDKLADASLHLNAGAKFIATNADTSLPTERGPVVGNGAILAALQATTQVSPIVMGKPEPIMYQQAIKILGITPEKTIAIGDRLNTDILGAVNTHIRSIMVLTGISQKEDIKSVDYQPTWVMSDIQAVTEALLIAKNHR